MKKIYFLFFSCTTLFCLFQLAGCRKLEDLLRSNQSICRIQKITTNDLGGRTGVFQYDKYGNPISISFTNYSEQSPDYLFRYDNKHRLTDCIGLINNHIFYTFWHKYQYNVYGQIIKDSVYRDGSFSEDPSPIGHDNLLTTYTYDSKGRITRALTYSQNTLVNQQTFAYDQKGNLVRQGLRYDNRLNIRATNKIWMFIDKDYSVNNPIPAVAYNEFALPLKFNSSANKEPVYFFLNSVLDKSDIEYYCK